MKNRCNVFILTDMEGIAGIDHIDDIDPTTDQYIPSCRKLCESINLAVEASLAEGADRVYYLDGHGGGGNVRDEWVDQRAVKCSVAEWEALLKAGKIDCQIEIGAHARAGTIGGFLDHTISSKSIYSITVNGLEMSEFSLHAILCARYGVPIIAVTGDETACEQAKSYVPDLFAGAVKKAECRNVATTYPNADGILCDTVKRALANRQAVSCIRFDEPLTVRQTFYRTDMCEKAISSCKTEFLRVDARTIEKTVTSLSSYCDLKF